MKQIAEGAMVRHIRDGFILVVFCSFLVACGGGGGGGGSAGVTTGTGVLSVSPAGGLTFSGPVSSPFSPPSVSYTLTNTGSASLNWAASKTQPWVTLSSAGDTLAVGATATVTISINSDANSLTAGSYSDTVSFTNTTNGDGNTTRSVGLTVTAPTMSVTKISAGGLHSLALASDGTIKAWGGNIYGQLGNDDFNNSNVPVSVSGINNATGIAAGGIYDSIAVLADGTVKEWGATWGTTGSRVPVTVPGISSAMAVAGDGYHSLALLSNGTVKAWGMNFWGQLGNATYIDSINNPVSVVGINNAIAISAGLHYSLALLSDGTIKEWGKLPRFPSQNNSSTPVTVPGINSAIAIAAGTGAALALLNDGTVMAWGAILQLPIYSDVPVIISGINNAKAIAAGNSHFLIVMSDGTIKAFGDNIFGQLGIGTNAVSIGIFTVTGISSASAISAGTLHSLALMQDGNIKSWGYNDSGQLGDGTFITKFIPVNVIGLP